ncbi:MAG TPA: ATP-binding protein, partial [Tepidisphaeraceae bacterium]|nr:ATP-binding protein [Tepidisphaeraceae bacterium]
LGLFARVVQSHDLAGVLLAHHADDQAETVLQRLLRGSGPMGLAGMSPRTCVGGLTIVRPLLAVRRAALRAELARRGVDWREDASNATDAYARNRLRKLLADRDDLVNDLLALGGACGQLRAWVDAHAPLPADVLRPSDLDGLPDVLRRAVLAKWLRAAGVPDVEPGAVERLLAMLTDAATGARQTFAGNVSVRRRGGVVFVHRG